MRRSARSHATSTRIAALTSDNAAQQEGLRQVRKLVDAKFAELRETIQGSQEVGPCGRLAGHPYRSRQKIMDAMRGVIAEMKNREQRLLDARMMRPTPPPPHHLDDCRVDAHRTAGVWLSPAWS